MTSVTDTRVVNATNV